MSIFNTSNIHSMTNLGSAPVTSVSAYESMNEGAAAIMFESELNFSNMMKAVGIEEVNHYAAKGESVVYESGRLSGFFSKMKEFFRNLNKKIKELFNKFIMMIDGWIRSDKDFVKKHRTTILKVDTKGFEYKGYKFTTDATSTQKALGDTTSYLAKNDMAQGNVGPFTGERAKKQDTQTKGWNDNKADHIESMRAIAAGKTGKLTAKEFDEALFEIFRNGKDSAETMDKINASEVLETISNFKKQKDNAKKSMDAIEKLINKIIEDLNKQERELSKSTKDETQEVIQGKASAMRYVTAYSAAQKDRLGVIQKLHGSLMSSMKHENRQAKSICVRLVGYSPKNESGTVTNESSGLNSVNFI